ncbi:MAG: GNAT family N-acetyltransferase [Rhizobiaceae bacterium]|nr:GNAT family N-acetyltransferase [Rhizobiaceae bacterium]
MHVDVIERLEDLDGLKDDWDRLYEIDPEAHYFLSRTWISSWFASRALPWFVLAVRENADSPCIALFPIQLGTGLDRGKGFYNAIVIGGSYFASCTGILCDPAFVEAATPALADRIKSFNWTSLHLDDVDLSCRRMQSFIEHFPLSDFSEERVKRPSQITDAAERVDPTIHVHVPLPEDFSSFLHDKLHRRVRRNVRRSLRQMDDSAAFQVTHSDAGTIDEDLTVLLNLWDRQWGARNPRYTRYLVNNSRAMLPDCFASGSLFLPILWKGVTPLAAAAILIDRPRKCLICFVSARDTVIRGLSPGLMLHAHVIRWAIENGFRIYDLGAGDYAHKYIFGSDVRRIERFRVDTRTKRNLGERLDPHCLPFVIARIRSLLAPGDLSDAEIGCRQVLAVDPGHEEALTLYREIVASRALWEATSPEDAANSISDHVAIDRIDAEKQARAAIAQDPADFDAVHRLSILLLLRGEGREAEAEIGRALELRPDSAAAHCSCGNILAAIGDFEGAIARYDRAVALEPAHAIAYNNRGNALRRLGLVEEALASYKKAIEIRPDYEQALANRASLLDEKASALSA